MKGLFTVTVGIACALVAATALRLAAVQPLAADKLEISAFAVNMSNIATGSNAVVDITINSWS